MSLSPCLSAECGEAFRLGAVARDGGHWRWVSVARPLGDRRSLGRSLGFAREPVQRIDLLRECFLLGRRGRGSDDFPRGKVVGWSYIRDRRRSFGRRGGGWGGWRRFGRRSWW